MSNHLRSHHLITSILTCPGQGAQQPEMLQHWPDHPVFIQTRATSEAVLGQALSSLDSPEALQHSRSVQLALLINAVAWGRYLLNQGCHPHGLLGLSIGAYPAAVLAGCLKFEDALELVALRGTLMQNAFPEGYGMMAVQGLDRYQLTDWLSTQQAPVYLANINAEQQCVLFGAWTALNAQKPALQAAGAHCQPLKISVPSHCPLMDNAAQTLAQAFNTVTLQAPQITYVSASKARVLRTTEAIREDLAMNMARQVKWFEASRLLVERGLTVAIELPPSGILTGLFKRLMPQGHCLRTETTRLDTLQYLTQPDR